MSIFIMPVENHRITSKYNPNRKHPVTGKLQKHAGIDIVDKKIGKAPIYATANGKVRLIKDTGSTGYGKHIIITHDIGGQVYESVYAHLDSFKVKQGDLVKQSQMIATMGNTGIGTGIHLHFELHRGSYEYANGTYPNSFDPEPWVTEFTKTVSDKGLDLIKKYEGFYPQSYLDPVSIWTIGYGTTKWQNGSKVSKGQYIKQQEASILLEQQVNEHAEQMFKYIKVDLEQNQFDALASFAYNLGANIFAKDPALTSYINKKDWKNTARVMKLYNKAGGKVLAGLQKRRNEEAALLLNSSNELFEGDEILNFTITTTRNAAREVIKQAVDKKHIGSEWLTKFDQGKMTTGDFIGLQVIISNKK